MITIKTDTEGNIVFKNNRVIFLEGKDAMVQECWHRAFLFQGDDMFNVDRGILDMRSLRGSLQTTDVLEDTIRTDVESHEDVSSASVFIDDSKDTLNIQIEVDSEYGRLKI